MHIRLVFRQGPHRRGLAATYSSNIDGGGWFLVPTTFDGTGREYHWDRRLPGKYRTKREALAARKMGVVG